MGGSHSFLDAETEKIKIPDGILAIDSYAFKDTHISGDIVFPSSLTSIGRQTFENCWLTSADLKNTNITEILDSTFNGCSQLIKATLPNCLKTIGWGAFRDDYQLASVEILKLLYSFTNEFHRIHKILSREPRNARTNVIREMHLQQLL